LLSSQPERVSKETGAAHTNKHLQVLFTKSRLSIFLSFPIITRNNNQFGYIKRDHNQNPPQFAGDGLR
jgi:hypothetical protein